MLSSTLIGQHRMTARILASHWSTQNDKHENLASDWLTENFWGCGWLGSGNAKNAKKQQLESVTTTTVRCRNVKTKTLIAFQLMQCILAQENIVRTKVSN